MTTRAFAAAQAPLNGEVHVPGSKSLSNRALICAALADGTSTIRGVANGNDTARMIEGLRGLGAEIVVDPSDSTTVEVRRAVATKQSAAVTLQSGLAGTTSRFLTAVAALRAGETTIDGEAGLRRRPMRDLHTMLRQLGVEVTALGEPDCLPVVVRGAGLQRGGGLREPRSVVATGGVSSQFVSAVMMIGPRLGGISIALPDDMVSREYVQMTAEVMRAFSADVRIDANHVVVAAAGYSSASYTVGGDWSSASYPLAAGAIAGGTIRVPGVEPQTAQPEAAFIDALIAMGCSVKFVDGGVVLNRDPQRPLSGIDIDMSQMSDLVPTLAVIAACASSDTIVRGVGFIRAKESDRLGDLAHELRACGVEVDVRADGLRISPRPLRPAQLDAHDDHRLAMSLALLGLRCDGVAVREPDVVAKSWPDFWQSMASGLGIGVRDEPRR